MNRKLANIFSHTLLFAFFILSLLYIWFVIEPVLIFHQAQPPFLNSPDFITPFFKYPGGPAELLANFVLQSFCIQFAGAGIFFAIVFLMGLLMFGILNRINKRRHNIVGALVLFSVTITLANNYYLPFSIIISVALVLIFLWVLVIACKNLISGIILFTVGATTLYYIAGSGYLVLFSAASLFVTVYLKRWNKLIFMAYILAVAFLFPLVASKYLFAVAIKQQYFCFFAPRAWFMNYQPSAIFFVYLLLIPVLPAIAIITTLFNKPRNNTPTSKLFILNTSLAVLTIAIVAFLSHMATYRSDAKKIVQADYYCYQNQADETAKAATSLKNYSFAANLNYNLVMSKTDQLTENFFHFVQIKGTEALHPDVEFASEFTFIASEFYYDLAFITEARHWAYESLVFYPYSPRALQNLVKIHLVMREYKAAERTLNILSKSLVSTKFVREFSPYITDTLLVASNGELMEKRSFIPAEGELSPSINRRFEQLLDANSNNKTAFEYLMLYYLLDGQLDSILAMYPKIVNHFAKPVAVYEEALLMYAANNGISLPSNIKISPETMARYTAFKQKAEQYKGKTRLARNALYADFGKTYFYYLQYVYPLIIKPDIENDESEYPSI